MNARRVSRPRIITLKEGMMLEKFSIPLIGAVVIAGIGIEQLGGIAMVFAVGSLILIAISLLFIWSRVDQLTRDTSKLTEKVGTLNTKVTNLEETMTPCDLGSE